MPTHVATKRLPLTLQATASKTSKRAFLVSVTIVSLMIGVVALSYFVLSHQSLRLDESQSIWQSSHSLTGTLTVISHDVHVPLYGLLLHFWIFLVGLDVNRLRVLSLLFFLAAIPAMYFLARTTYKTSVALFATLLLASSPFLNWYGDEIRMYSLLALMAILSQYFFLRIADFKHTQKGNLNALWWGYAISSIVGIYVHYFFWFVLFSEAIFFFWYKKDFPEKSLRNFILVAGACVAAVLPWLWFVKSQGGISNATPHLLKPSSVDLFNALSQFVFGFQNDHINTVIVSMWPLAVLFGFLSMRKKNRLPKQARFFLLSAVLPVALAFVVSVFYEPIFLSRYLILAAPSLYIFLAWFFSTFPPKFATAFKLLLVSVMLFTLFQQTTSADTPVKENYQQASQYITNSASSHDIVALSAPFTLYPFEYYYKGQAAITTIPLWDPYGPGAVPSSITNDQLAAQVDNLKQNHDKIWLLLSYNQGYQEQVYQYFENHFLRLDHKQFSPGLDLYEYQLRY